MNSKTQEKLEKAKNQYLCIQKQRNNQREGEDVYRIQRLEN